MARPAYGSEKIGSREVTMMDSANAKIFLLAALAVFPMLALSSGRPVARPAVREEVSEQVAVERSTVKQPWRNEMGAAARPARECQRAASKREMKAREKCGRDDFEAVQTGRTWR